MIGAQDATEVGEVAGKRCHDGWLEEMLKPKLDESKANTTRQIQQADGRVVARLGGMGVLRTNQVQLPVPVPVPGQVNWAGWRWLRPTSLRLTGLGLKPVTAAADSLSPSLKVHLFMVITNAGKGKEGICSNLVF